MVAAAILLLVAGWALFPSVFASGDPYALVPRDKMQPPSLHHWFGTDSIGRDLYTRVVHGAELSLSATISAVAIAFVVGSVVGLLAGAIGGAIGGVVDTVLMRVVDVLLSIPTLLLSLAVVTALGFGTTNVAIAVGVTMIAGFARVMRAEVARVRHATYVEAAFLAGSRWPSVLLDHILRNAIAPVIGLAAAQFGLAVLLVSSLSFLGFGAKPPSPEWGTLIADGRNYLVTAWWLTVIPGLVIVAVVVSAHRVGRALQDRR
ncbi:ABC transporter permease [Williamsia serinedens]